MPSPNARELAKSHYKLALKALGFFRTYARALSLLASEKWLAMGLVLANLAIGLMQLAEPVLLGRVVDALAHNQNALPLIALWAGIGLFGILAGVTVSVLADRLAHRQRLKALAIGFEQAITLPWGYHAERGSGALVRTLLAGTDALFWIWLTFLREHLSALVSIGFLVPAAIAMQPQLAAILGILASLYALANAVVVIRTSEGQNAVESFNQDLFGRVGDVIGNINVVQSFSRLNEEAIAVRGLMGRLLSAQYPVLTWWAILTVLTRAAATLTMVAVFAAGSMLAERGEVSVGEIVSFVSFATLLISKLDLLSSFSARIFGQLPTVRSYFELIEMPLKIPVKPDALPLHVSKGEVCYEKVSFTYGGSVQGVFDLTFRAKPGETIALVGATGSGKTTALSFLQRLRDPDQGQIRIDGQPLVGVKLDSLRHAIGMVFQDAGLFNRSIADNIRVGRPSASDLEVIDAAKRAQAHEFIEKKPSGYDFVIGERGASLSGGERQRLAIARALLKDAPILILDEATSALDSGTEVKIQRALDALRKNRTTFIIAHRLSTVLNADQILVFKAGRIVERGTFKSLYAAQGLFREMVKEGGFAVPESEPET